ncbi:hypothetical protein B0H10DRAFT_1960356 [Mycena sp. CBHHK59/15]|nr:hypothetical protein B0H10DRAFT_1960356 [Mycena sp. CBHHK59/15]
MMPIVDRDGNGWRDLHQMHASPTPSLLNVAAQPVAADVRVQPHYLGLSASRSVVPAPLDSTANARRRPSRFQSALPRLAPPRPGLLVDLSACRLFGLVQACTSAYKRRQVISPGPIESMGIQGTKALVGHRVQQDATGSRNPCNRCNSDNEHL